MREIKFRAFSKHDAKYVKQGQTGLMFYQKTIEDKDGIPELWFVMEKDEDFRYPFENVMLDDDWIKMQFTGLPDKNGKEIYEGDIVAVKYSINRGQYSTYHDTQLTIKWNERKSGFYPFISWNDIYETEVIGNIFENKELLKGA